MPSSTALPAARTARSWYYREMVNVFHKAGSGPLIDELDRIVTELEHLAK